MKKVIVEIYATDEFFKETIEDSTQRELLDIVNEHMPDETEQLVVFFTKTNMEKKSGIQNVLYDGSWDDIT